YSDPGNSGATFFIEITPEAQLICNNSPRFKSIPPIVICADFPLNFDHSSIDKDGDSLTYEFCSLFAGGGPGGGVVFPGTVGACQSPTPDPRACPPPFVLLNLVAGFSFADPLGQGILKLNETNGLLTGLPLDLGQFVVGICVKEFRNGKLIGSIRREFQFNVSACDQFNSGINSPSKSEFFKVEPNSSIVFDVLLNDSITSGNPISVIIEKPQYGSIIYSQLTGKGTYTPNNRFFGKEILMYKVCPMGCIDACRTSTVEFDVLPPCSDRNSLVLPNVIFPDSPSGDNRYFIVEALKDCPDAFGPKPTKLTVYNRWGDLVYRNDDYKNDWDGTNTQGQPLPTGTYYYLLDLGSVSAPIKGYVVIMR
ncbi:MAG: gliding motility-associated C-terminal domain-containing protein, partial [Saprospiraceae bacterium]|nr:gliding motility-associated C-terminal domain-containing protein [Saprospiraceae bacterium]